MATTLQVEVNMLDLLTAEEVRRYPGRNLGPEHFDKYILTVLSGEFTRAYLVVDGASQDRGPTEVEELSSFDASALNAEDELREELRKLVRDEIEDELSEMD